MKKIGTYHGAFKTGLGMAKLGALGPGRANPGTVNTIDTMGTGRVISVGSTSMVNPHKISGGHGSGTGGKMTGGLKNCKKGVTC